MILEQKYKPIHTISKTQWQLQARTNSLSLAYIQRGLSCFWTLGIPLKGTWRYTHTSRWHIVPKNKIWRLGGDRRTTCSCSINVFIWCSIKRDRERVPWEILSCKRSHHKRYIILEQNTDCYCSCHRRKWTENGHTTKKTKTRGSRCGKKYQWGASCITTIVRDERRARRFTPWYWIAKENFVTKSILEHNFGRSQWYIVPEFGTSVTNTESHDIETD